MQLDVARQVRRTLTAMLRRTPLVRGVFRQLDELRATNAALAAGRDQAVVRQAAAENERNDALAQIQAAEVQRDRAETARWNAIRDRDQAEAARWNAIRDRDQAEAARWNAVREREEAEKARWEAVAEREIAERARWAAVRQREEAETARRQALLGYPRPPARPKITQPISAAPPRPSNEAPQILAIRPNGGAQQAQTGGMKISILLANYNHGRFIKGNIESTISQTYRDWEMVIIDDGSTDGSQDIIRSFAKLDSRIVPTFLPENRGVIAAIEVGLGKISGSLLHASAADDYIASDSFFEQAIAALETYPSAAGVFGKAKVIDTSSGAELWVMGSGPTPGYIEPTSALKTFLMGGLFVPGAAAIWRRTHVDGCGGFDYRLGPQTDFFVNHALPATAGVVFINQVFAAVRSSDQNYHRSDSEEEFFKRHALLENKLRALDLPTPLDPIWVRIWRDRLINGRLGVTRQQQIYATLRGALTGIEAWEQGSLPAEFTECSSRILGDLSRWERELDERVSSAHRVLDALAGPLGLESEAAQ